MTLKGEWWNELGSKMVITLDPADPLAIAGEYHTKVGDASGRVYPLRGRCGTPGPESQVVAWVVAWDPPDDPKPGDPPNKPSVTGWVGQLQSDPDSGTEFISTTWLLNRTTKVLDDWQSTIVGADYFTRAQPSPAKLELSRRVGKAAAFLGV